MNCELIIDFKYFYSYKYIIIMMAFSFCEYLVENIMYLPIKFELIQKYGHAYFIRELVSLHFVLFFRKYIKLKISRPQY